MNFESNNLLEWLKNNVDILKPRLVIDEAFNISVPGYHKVCMFFHWAGQEMDSQGIGRSLEEAMQKSVAEAIERIVVKSIQAHSTNGFAAHPERMSAQENAINELIERDAFFCHFLTSTPFLTFDLSEFSHLVPSKVTQYLNEMSEFGVDWKVAQMRSAVANRFSLIAAASSLSSRAEFGVVFTTATDRNLGKALSKVLLELVSNLNWMLSGESIEPLSERDFFHLDHFGPHHHKRVGIHTSQRSWFRTMFDSGIESVVHSHDLPYHIEVSEILIPESLQNPPLHVVQASCNGLQPHFLGITKPEKVNLARLSAFTGRDLSFDDVYKAPSIFG